MTETVSHTAAVIGTAAFLGVMLCIGVTLGSYWRSLPADEFLRWFARNNPYVARSVPLTVAPALAGLAASVAVDWGESDAWLWATSTLCVVAVLGITGAYFVPTNAAFAEGRVTPDDVPDRLGQWLRVRVGRIVLTLGAAIVACVAMEG